MTLDPALDVYPWRLEPESAHASGSGRDVSSRLRREPARPAPSASSAPTRLRGRALPVVTPPARLTSTPATAAGAPALPLVVLLRQIARLIGGLGALQYTMQPVGPLAGSVGGHVRHGLDHVEALLGACARDASGVIDYERRSRGSLMETHPSAALDALDSLQERLLRIEPAQLERVVRVRTLLASDVAPIETVSTLGRELAYVVSHTTHHNAILAAMAKTLGSETPELFGFAASTIVHQDRLARSGPGARSRPGHEGAGWR